MSRICLMRTVKLRLTDSQRFQSYRRLIVSINQRIPLNSTELVKSSSILANPSSTQATDVSFNATYVFFQMTVYLKYPYVLYESFMPMTAWLWYVNPLDLEWTWNCINLFLFNILWVPRVWYWRSLQYRICRMYLLRGGKAVKIETQSLSGDRFTSWVENFNFHPLQEDQKYFDDKDNAEFLSDEGQLKYELATQLDNLTEMSVTSQDIIIYFMKQGVVHHPELFEAVVKGYNIDTSDFVINTAHNLRAMEGNHHH
eukprot:TRINITY_DN1118_c0_g1_i4.p2 TRINITY_DN1118_c0_g1~~TRINITY_DN1118_c0_g1_i4.p2  ORF type:complete len:256 (-),score=20.96 TRINITY_DN1118_c0_g1_i4:196-963(-)